tara:strand:+ start:921 stop:1499 length:579 start_codon:yes stop_codon:yes gene_type:complete
MFRINKPTATNSGEVLKPFLVENKTVYCFDYAGRTIIKTLDDFNFDIEKKKSMFTSGPTLSVAALPPIVRTEQQIERIIEPLEEEEVKRPTLGFISVPSDSEITEVTEVIDTTTKVVVTDQPSPTSDQPHEISNVEKVTVSKYEAVTPIEDDTIIDEVQVGGVRRVEVTEDEKISTEVDNQPGDYINDEDYI